MLNLLSNTTFIPNAPFRRNSVRPLPQAITDDIPLEVYEIIIDFLQGDHDSLSACALVCKTWLPISQRHLFRKIAIMRSNYHRFLDALRDFPGFRARMQASVHTLTIIQAVRVRRCWSYELVPCLVGFNIENLVFKRLNPSDPSNYDVIPHPRVFESLAQSLTELQLYMSKFASLIHLVELICSLHKLERLSIESVTWFHIDQEFPSSERYKLPPKLQELQISLRRYDGALTTLMEWVAQYRGGALPAIHTLSIRSQFSVNDRYVYTPAAIRVLANVGSSLRRLTLANFFEPRGRWEYPELLAANTELHTLCFRDIDLRDRFEANRILVLRVSWIPSFLIQIASTSVEMMSFEILVRDVEHLGILEWQEIGRAFSLPRFAKLKRLEFKVSAPEQEAARWIEARLPLELMQRGVVHVSRLH